MAIPRVLVLDDSPTALALACRTVRRAGYEAVAVGCFVELSGALEGGADAIVLDLNLPAMSGESLGSFIRRRPGDLIPLVLFSGESPARLASAARELGAIAAVSKLGADSQRELGEAVRQAVESGRVSSPG